MNREGRTFWMGCFGQRMTGRRSKRGAETKRRNALVSLSTYCPHRPDADTGDHYSINKLAATVRVDWPSPHPYNVRGVRG